MKISLFKNSLASLRVNKYVYSLLLILAGIGLAEFFSFSSSEAVDEDKEFQKHFRNNYKIFSLTIPEKLDFAGEKVPLNDFDVRERLDRELLVNTYWQSHTLLYHKRANKWFPVIEPILKKNEIPTDFKYLSLIESGFMQVVSPAGATGFWQLLEGTAQEYGLEVNKEVDERYHVEKATEAACKYLQEAYDKYGTWTLAAASYNMGMNGVSRQLERQKATDYYDLLLNEETARYVFRILAVKQILENSKKYGFHFREKDLYQPYEFEEVKVDTAVTSFPDFAKKYGLSYKELKLLNPWLCQSYLTNSSNKEYTIKILKKKNQSIPEEDIAPENDTAAGSPP